VKVDEYTIEIITNFSETLSKRGSDSESNLRRGFLTMSGKKYVETLHCLFGSILF
jgi:hypothetical protein